MSRVSKVRNISLIVSVVIALLMLVPLQAMSEEDAAPAAAFPLKIVCKRAVGDQFKYHATAKVSGTMTVAGASEAAPIELTLDMVIKYSVIKPTVPDMTDILINTESANILVGDMKIPAPAMPQTIITLDSSGKIKNVLGMDKIEGLSGTNISSLMALMLAVFPQSEIEPNDEWTSGVIVSSAKKKLTVKYMLLGTEKVGEQDSAKVKQNFELVSLPVPEGAKAEAPTTRGEATSNFSIADGRLLKTQAQIAIHIKSETEKDSPAVDANVKLDVNLMPN